MAFIVVYDACVLHPAPLSAGLAEDLLAQIATYTNLRAFTPTRGDHAGRRGEVEPSTVCLLVLRAEQTAQRCTSA